MDNLPDMFLIKLGDFSTGVRVITQPLHIFQYGLYKFLTKIRHTLLQVISFDLLEVIQGRTGDSYLHLLCAK